MDFALAVRQQFPQEIAYCEEYDGAVFSWGGDGLEPARKKRRVVRPVEAVGLDVLVEELKSGIVREGHPPHPQSIPTGYELELRFKNGSTLRRT